MESNYGVWRSLRDGDFEEEDVWAVLKQRKDFDSNSSFESPSISVQRQQLSTAARTIPRSISGNSNEGKGVSLQSAPVTIPDWSKIYGKKSNNSFKNHHDLDYDDDDDNGFVDDGRDSEDDEDVYDCKVVPPHEFIARRVARSQISSFSVFEGAGRTLKGRDLSKVRNAVLTKTGFLE